jgi:hypothetical protein
VPKPLHIIYIPGLGDIPEPRAQLRAVAHWPKHGVESELFQMSWGDGKPWQPKFDRLLVRIDELLSNDRDVALIGASAGAGAAINAFTARKNHLVGVVCIAGKVNRPNTIGSQYRRSNPAFVTSAKACEIALTHLGSDDRARILSRYALLDETVYKADSRIPGATNQLLPTVTHFLTIAYGITFGMSANVRFLKKLQATDK